MSGSPGDGEGTVYLAHAWACTACRPHTTGPWHWWNVYKDRATAVAQAARVANSWRCDHGRSAVHEIQGDVT